jgi:hypothetical protein
MRCDDDVASAGFYRGGVFFVSHHRSLRFEVRQDRENHYKRWIEILYTGIADHENEGGKRTTAVASVVSHCVIIHSIGSAGMTRRTSKRITVNQNEASNFYSS